MITVRILYKGSGSVVTHNCTRVKIRDGFLQLCSSSKKEKKKKYMLISAQEILHAYIESEEIESRRKDANSD